MAVSLVRATDPTVAALAATAETGLLVRGGEGQINARTLQGTANEIEWTNADGSAGPPTARLSNVLAFTGKTANGGTFNTPTLVSPAISGLADPVSAQDPATMSWVQTLFAGLRPKQNCLCKTTANITLSGLQTIDGVTVSAGDRVLVGSQSAPSGNGVYVAASGAWSRATDMDVWSEIPGAWVIVERGTSNADTVWFVTADQGGTLNTTSITWSQFFGPGLYQGKSANLDTYDSNPLAAAELQQLQNINSSVITAAIWGYIAGVTGAFGTAAYVADSSLVHQSGTENAIAGAKTFTTQLIGKGTATNDSAAAGYIGELLSATAATVALSNGVYKTMVSLSLTAGDWDVQGNAIAIGDSGSNTTFSKLYAMLSLVNNTGDFTLDRYASFYTTTAGYTLNNNGGQKLVTPMARFSLSATTTIYLVMYTDCSGNAFNCDVMIRARRVR